MARTHVDDLESGASGCGADFFDGLFVKGGVVDDAAGSDVYLGQFELWFDKNEQVCAGFGNGVGWRQHLCGGNEGNIDDDEIYTLGNVLGAQFSGVAFDANYARVLVEFPSELVDVDVHGVDTLRAFLQQAIGEASSGRSDIEANLVGGVDCKIG